MLPARPQTFGLENCRDLLNKLAWEIEGLKNQDSSVVDGLMFRAWNACVTAWHLTDWVWREMTDAQKDDLASDICANLAGIADFQKYVRSACRPMHAFRHIATASKHWTVDQYPDPGIDADISASSSAGMALDSSRLGYPDWILKVTLDGDRVRLIDILEVALNFWTEFIYHRNISA